MATQQVAAGRQRRTEAPKGLDMVQYRIAKALSTPAPYLTAAGVGLWLFSYWLLCEGLEIWRFNKLPGPVAISHFNLGHRHERDINMFSPLERELITSNKERKFASQRIA